jgi:hypothetical protein
MKNETKNKPPQFPTMLRKMWSGSEVQDWINEHWVTPPQRKPLTSEEIDAIVVDEVGLDADADEMHGFARAIEQAHGIKGEA